MKPIKIFHETLYVWCDVYDAIFCKHVNKADMYNI